MSGTLKSTPEWCDAYTSKCGGYSNQDKRHESCNAFGIVQRHTRQSKDTKFDSLLSGVPMNFEYERLLPCIPPMLQLEETEIETSTNR